MTYAKLNARPMTLAEAAAFHRAQVPAFQAMDPELYQPGNPESPAWGAERCANALAEALDAVAEGRPALVPPLLDAFYKAYDDGEVDFFFGEEREQMEATYYALALKYAPEALRDWLRLPDPRILTDLPAA